MADHIHLAEVSPELERAIAVLHAKDYASIVALADIATERVRQIEVEGWSVEHDDEHEPQSLQRAAACYLIGPTEVGHYNAPATRFWPWAPEWWKPGSPVRNRIKAGALLVAEMGRHYRSAPHG